MKKNKLVVLAVLLSAGAGWAIAEGVTREVADKPRHFPKGIYIGADSQRVIADTENKIGVTCGGKIDYVFPALSNDGGSIACAVSPYTVACEGAQVGDPCFAGSGYGQTQVLDNHPNAWAADRFDCFVLDAGVVTLRRCGGQSAPALADAGYLVRVIGPTAASTR